MSSGEGASQYCTSTEHKPIETCHKLLKSGDFLGVRFIIYLNQLESSRRHAVFEQAKAICDVLIAAENRLPNGLMDLYGMIRVNQLEPVLSEDFEKLMKLLDTRRNRFPFCQEAAEKALLAWSLLSKPFIKAHYDLVVSADHHNRETQGNGQSGEGSKGKRKMGLRESEYWKAFPNSFIPKNDDVGPGADGEVVVTSDDDDAADDAEETISMARTAKVFVVNGRRVKVLPLKKKKTNYKDNV